MAERARIASNLPVRHCPRHLLRAERCRRRESSTEIHWLVEMLHKVPASPGPGDRSSPCFCFWLASWYTTRLPVGWSERVPPRHAMTGELESFYPACLLTAKLNCPDFCGSGGECPWGHCWSLPVISSSFWTGKTRPPSKPSSRHVRRSRRAARGLGLATNHDDCVPRWEFSSASLFGDLQNTGKISSTRIAAWILQEGP